MAGGLSTSSNMDLSEVISAPISMLGGSIRQGNVAHAGTMQDANASSTGGGVSLGITASPSLGLQNLDNIGNGNSGNGNGNGNDNTTKFSIFLQNLNNIGNGNSGNGNGNGNDNNTKVILFLI